MQYTLNFSESEFRNYQIMKDAYKKGDVITISRGKTGWESIYVLTPNEFQQKLLDEIVRLKNEIRELSDRNWDLQVQTAGLVDKAKKRWFL